MARTVIINPATGEKVGQYKRIDVGEGKTKVAQAKKPKMPGR
jgi:hypothetical protein